MFKLVSLISGLALASLSLPSSNLAPGNGRLRCNGSKNASRPELRLT